jgi:hypothetical protein
MKEFIFVFRANYSDISKVSPEETQNRMEQWTKWIDSIASQNKLAEGGNHLSTDGKVLRHKGVITDGPYNENKVSILGYILIKAISYQEAVELAKGCPILGGDGNSVEVREIATT